MSSSAHGFSDQPAKAVVDIPPNKNDQNASQKPMNPLPIMVGMLIGVPLLCFLMMQFMVMPKLIAAVDGKVEMLQKKKPVAAEHEGANKCDLGKVMVNLSSEKSSESRFLRTNIVFASDKADIKEEVKASEVQVRDAIITLLSSQSLESFDKPDGRDNAKRIIIAKLNGILGAGAIRQMYFTEFVIQ